MKIRRTPIQHLRRWLSRKLIEAATFVDDADPDVEFILAEVQKAIDAENLRSSSLVHPSRPPPIVEPVWDGSRRSTVDVLLHVAILVEKGYVSNFSLNWLGPEAEPTTKIQWPPDVGKA